MLSHGPALPEPAVDRSRLRDVDTWDDYNAVCEAFGFAPAAEPPL